MTNCSFTKLAMEMEGGGVEEEMSALVDEVTGALGEFGGKGEVSLTLKMERNEFGRIEIRPQIKAKKPRRGFQGNQYRVLPDGRLELFEAPADGKAKASGVTLQ